VEKEEYDMLFHGEQQDDADAGEGVSADASVGAAMGGGNGVGSITAIPTFAVSATTCVIVLFSW